MNYSDENEYLRDAEEIYVVEHLLCLRVFSAKDDHKHGISGSLVRTGGKGIRLTQV